MGLNSRACGVGGPGESWGMLFRWCAVFGLMCLALNARGQALDGLVASPELWETQRSDFVEKHGAMGFYWLSEARDRAETHLRSVTLFSEPVCEVDAEFGGEKLSGLTFSIYNRGDAADITREQLTALVTYCTNQLTALTKVQWADEGQEASDAVKAHALVWRTAVSDYRLEYSFTREVKTLGVPFRAEFVRLRITPAEKPKSFMAEALASASPQGVVFDGPSHVKKDVSGDVRIETVPMVDQGQKGYCVVATAERVMRYYGIPVDEHELAEMANTSATRGTSDAAMLDSLKKLSQRLQVKVRFLEGMDVRQILALIREYNLRAREAQQPVVPDQGPVLDVQQIYTAMNPALLKAARTHNKAEVDRFQQMVQDHIDQGIPILWSVIVGVVPEANVPKGIGGHMRLIIGYNTSTNQILYSDSWGPGFELERMPVGDAWTMTTAMNTIEPIGGSEDEGP